ncbi:hypothetical protein [Human adenovirus 21a]|uniref:11.5 kDa protein n=2 Tax=Human adenovirus 21 TaxID=32608 RepID=A0A075IKI6_9ADEN|nr:11.5 kDa protein [Human adenovirus 21a]AJA02120.1 hypothetical 11.5 kDa protein [Human adenovirus 21]AIF29716.1 11.5 kDa protein [Human adenovirus 21a]AIF29764.1 11.5 kDa protein [Human adenovirus 21a]AIF29812.1 11.5 kDa protein [Human adenovirus 21a]
MAERAKKKCPWNDSCKTTIKIWPDVRIMLGEWPIACASNKPDPKTWCSSPPSAVSKLPILISSPAASSHPPKRRKEKKERTPTERLAAPSRKKQCSAYLAIATG